MPLFIEKEVYKPYTEREIAYSTEEGMALLKNNLQELIYRFGQEEIEVTGSDIRFIEDDLYFRAEGTLQVIQKTGQLSAFDENLRREGYNEYFTDDNGNPP